MRTSSVNRTRVSTGGYMNNEHVQNIHILKFLPSQILHQLMSENVSAEDHTGSLQLFSPFL